MQVLLGFLIGFLYSLAYIFYGILGGRVGENYYEYWWQCLYEFIYQIIAIGFVEEFVFRGFVYTKIKILANSDVTAILLSSLIFGFYHVV